MFFRGGKKEVAISTYGMIDIRGMVKAKKPQREGIFVSPASFLLSHFSHCVFFFFFLWDAMSQVDDDDDDGGQLG